MSKRPAAASAKAARSTRPTAKKPPAGRGQASRSAAKPAAAKPVPAKQAAAQPPAPVPPTLRVAAVVLALEAAGLMVATAFSAAATINGKSYQTGSGVALTLIAFGTALALGLVALGLARARPWSRTPSGMIQLFAIIAGVILLDGHRPEWGVPTLILAAVGLVTVFTPASFKALNRER